MTAVESFLQNEDIHAYLARNQRKELLRFLTCGSVDDGKSTLIGRLLHDTKMIYEDQLAAVKRDSARHGTTGDGMDLALLTDGLKAEREQGITIDVAYRFFSTAKRKFIIADTPGHEQYTRNMATGASTCQLAIILVDARHGVLPQTRRHSYICSLLGIQHLVVTINKMDLVEYSEARFNEIKAQYSDFAAKLDIRDIHFIPISALKGDNIVDAGTHMPWHKSGPLLNHLETVHIASDRNLSDFRFPVQMVMRPNLNFRGFAGSIAAGQVRVGDTVMILPSAKKTRIKSIVMGDGELTQAQCPMPVVLSLTDEIDISRGDMIVDGESPPHFGHDFEANLVWLSEKPLDPDGSYLVKHGVRTTPAHVNIIEGIDVNTLESKPLDALHLNEVARCEISTTIPLAFDPYKKNRSTGAFILIDRQTSNTVACGMILDQESQPGPTDPWANLPGIDNRLRTQVPPTERSKRLGQKPCTVLLTGLTGSGKATIAFELERRLFDMGRTPIVLHGIELRRQIASDLGFSADDRSENLRRIGGIARILNDNGLIALCAVLAPLASVRQRVKKLIGADRYLEVYLSAPLEVCRSRDKSGLYALADAGKIKAFPGISSPYEVPDAPDLTLPTHEISIAQAVDGIIGLMKERGWI